MTTLNKNRPLGKISPPYLAPGYDKMAFYEQDGKFFDQNGKQIFPAGQTPPDEAPSKPQQAPPKQVAAVQTNKTMSPQAAAGKLLAQADQMAWPKFRAAAKDLLGDECPAGKAEMRAALEVLAGGKAERPAASNGVENDTGIDLAAWARGQQEYLFGDVAAAILKVYDRDVTERADAVDFLVEAGVITIGEARDDV